MVGVCEAWFRHAPPPGRTGVVRRMQKDLLPIGISHRTTSRSRLQAAPLGFLVAWGGAGRTRRASISDGWLVVVLQYIRSLHLPHG